MGFLKSIGKTIKKVGKKFLSTATGGISDAVFGALGNKITNTINPSDNRVSQSDNTHAQNLLDQNNPREIARQSSFLTGIAPAQASAYNAYQDATYGADTARQIERTQALAPVEAQTDLAYMDTVYAGTSPWERLGSSAAPSLSAPSPSDDPPSSNGAGAHSQFLPLLSTQMQTENAKEIALIQAQNAKDIAQIQTGAQLQAVGIQTADGTLPINQAAKSAADRLLTIAQTEVAKADEKLKGAQTIKTGFEANRIRQQTEIDAVATMLAAMPEEQIDLGLIKYKHKPGWKAVLGLMTGDQSIGGWTTPNISKQLQSLPNDQWQGVRRDALELAGILSKGSSAALNTLGNTKNFLRHIVPKK